MKIKNLSLAVLSAFFISACGSDNDDSYSQINVNGTWTEFNEWSYNSGDALYINDNQIEVSDWEDESFSLYLPIQAYNYMWWWSIEIPPFVLMTEHGLHDFHVNTDNWRYQLGKLEKTSTNKWTIRSPRDEGTGELTFDLNIKKVDISGQSIAATFPSIELDVIEDPEDWGDWIDELKNTKFPQGSYCLVPKSLTANANHMVGVISAGDADDTDYDDAALFDTLEDKYDQFLLNTTNTINKTLGFNATFTGSTLTGLATDHMLNGALKGNYDGLFYGVGIYSAKAQNLMYSDYYWDQKDPNLTATQKETLENRCVYFNETATDFLDNFNNQL